MTRPAAVLGWALLAVAVATWLTLVEVFWLPLRVGGVLVPVSVLAAAGGNPLLVSLAHRLSGSRLVGALPAAVWLGIVLTASTRRPEGDLLIVGGGAPGAVNLAFLLVGVVAAAGAVGRLVGAGRPRGVPAAGRLGPRRGGGGLSSRRGGSGSGGAR